VTWTLTPCRCEHPLPSYYSHPASNARILNPTSVRPLAHAFISYLLGEDAWGYASSLMAFHSTALRKS
jgi:hypothetical protein